MKFKKIANRFIVPLLLSLLLAACGGQQPVLPNVTLTQTPAPSATLTPTFIPTSAPTLTPIPPPDPISNTNAQDLVPVARCGVGRIHPSYTLAFSPDGKWLGTGGFGGVQIFNINDPSLAPIFLGQDFTTNIFAFSPTGTVLASLTPDKIIIWDFLAQKVIRTIDGNYGSNIYAPRQTLVFSKDGHALAFAHNNDVILYDVNTGAQIKQVSLNFRYASDPQIRFSPDLSILATSVTLALGGTVKLSIMDVQTGNEIFPLYGHSSGIQATAFSPDGKVLASASEDKTIILWDLTSGKKINTLRGHSDYLTSVVFSPDGKTLASNSADNSTILWDIASLKPVSKIETGWAALTFSPDSTLLAYGSGNKLFILDTNTGKQIGPISGNVCAYETNFALRNAINVVNSVVGEPTYALESTSYGFSLSPDNQHLIINEFDSFSIWNLQTGESQKYEFEQYGGLDVIYSLDGKLIAYSEMDIQHNSSIILLRADTGDKVSEIEVGKVGHIDSLVFSPDGKTLISGDEYSTISFWDIETGELKRTFHARFVDPTTGQQPEVPSSALQALAISPDGKILAGAYVQHGSIVLWDVASGQAIEMLNGGDFYISSYVRAAINIFGFSPDGSLLIANELIWGNPENLSRYSNPLIRSDINPSP